MTEDQNKPIFDDAHLGAELRSPGSGPAPGSENGDDDDLRELFRTTAPIARPVDVEALFSAFDTARSSRRRIAWPRSLGWPHSVLNPYPRRSKMLTTLKFAAAALVAAGAWFYFALVRPREASAFAEAAQKLRDAHTLAFRMSVEHPDMKAPMKSRSMIRVPSLMRIEADGGPVTIIDTSQGKHLILDPAAKTAVLFEGKATEPRVGPAPNIAERLRKLTEGDAKPVGERAFGDVRALGYLVKTPAMEMEMTVLTPDGHQRGPTRVKTPGMEMTIWVNPTTRIPVQIESSVRIEGKETRATSWDFQIDPELDDALFRLDVPAGYTLIRGGSDLLGMDDKTFLNPEKAAEALLRGFAEKTGGVFPKRIDDFELLKIAQSITRFMMATRELKGGFGYNSEGVKLGDADKILFWYRPEGAANYRALYGDFHASDVTEDKLPPMTVTGYVTGTVRASDVSADKPPPNHKP